MQIVFLPRACANLLRLRKSLEPHDEALAARSYDLLFSAARSLGEMPERGHPAAWPGNDEGASMARRGPVMTKKDVAYSAGWRRCSRRSIQSPIHIAVSAASTTRNGERSV